MAETYIAQCAKIFRLNPNPSEPQMQQVMKDIGCSRRTAYRALKEVRLANKMALIKNQSKSAKGKKKKSKKKTTKKKKKKSTKGRKKSLPKNIATPPSFQPPKPNKIPKISKNEPFEHFCKTHSFPYYKGLYRWQYDWFDSVWRWKFSLTLVARDHGKSIGHGNLCQWAMTAKGYDVLYLGWTNRRREIAQFVYNFFLIRKELIIDKASSPYHFRTIYGTKFDTYSVKSKEILGMHEMGDLEREITDENRYLEDFVRDEERPLVMIIDDAIDSTFRKVRHKERDLEDFYQSTIASINPDKMMTVGTHKFEGDFYFFLQEVLGDDLYVYKRGPFLKEDDIRYNKEPDNPTNLLCPERWIDGDHPDYELYLDLLELLKIGGDAEKKFFSPRDLELIKKKDLKKKRIQVGEYWYYSDYEQNPHPITGEVWDNIRYEKFFKGTAAYDLCVYSIDRATTQNNKSDYTGITVFFREKITADTPIDERTGKAISFKLVTNDYTQKIRITDLVSEITDIYKGFRKKFRYNIRIIIVVEKQGGGDDFCDLSEDAGAPYAHAIIRVHNTRNKLDRIEDNLGTPIQTGEVGFMDTLNTSELLTEIESFPYCSKIDALDSLSNGYFEAEKIPQSQMDPDKLISMLQQHETKTQQKQDWESLLQQNKNRRSIF